MKKRNVLMVLLLLLVSWTLMAGCVDSNNDEEDRLVSPMVGGTGGGSTGGGTSTTGGGLSTSGGVTSTSSGGLTGGTGGAATGGTGSTGGATGSTGGATATTGGTTTTGTTTGLPPGAQGPVTRTQLYSGLGNPSASAVIGTRVFYVTGFNLGANNGRLFTFDIAQAVANPAVNQPAAVQVTAATGSPLNEALTNPFDLITDGTNLYISVGTNSVGDGRIVQVSNINVVSATQVTATFTNLTASATPVPNNPLFLQRISVGGTPFIYWTEYNGAGTPGGQVRRVNLNDQTVSDIAQGLDFPAGFAVSGSNLVVCLNGAANRVIRFPVSPAGAPINSTDAQVTNILPTGGQTQISRPFDAASDGAGGVVFTEGLGLEVLGQASTAQGAGAIRYIPNGSNNCSFLAEGLTRAAGLSVQSLGNNVVVVATEAINLNGRLLRLVFDRTAAIGSQTPTQLDTGLDRPIHSIQTNGSVTPILVTENFQGGANGGRVLLYPSN